MIKEIIPVITPDNITDIQLLKDSMDIFLEYLTVHSDISIDIKNILDQDKTPLYEEFVKIYLNAITTVLSRSTHNEALYDALKTNYAAAGLNIDDMDLSVDITKLLSEDYILTNKSYKQAKGTPTAMEYIFNVIINSGVQNDFLGDNVGKFQFFEGKNVFEYTIEGTMIDAIYEHFVKPLTHPVGWAYFYQRVFYLSFTDYFNIRFEYTFAENGFEVRCMNGDVFKKDDYLTNISHEGLPLVEDNEVVFINVDYLGNKDSGTKRTTVYFASGEELISNDNPRSLILVKDNIELINYDNYDGNCGLYLEYNTTTFSTTDEEFGIADESHIASTTGKKNIVGAGNIYVGSTICGADIVNKNVSVTYKSYTGKHDGADYTNLFSAGGITEGDVGDVIQNLSGKTASDNFGMFQELEYCPINIDKPLLEDGRDNHRCEDIILDSFNYDRKWDDQNLEFDNFIWDNSYVSEGFEIHYDKNVWDSDLFYDNFDFDGDYVGGGFRLIKPEE